MPISRERTLILQLWYNMMYRCYNKDNKDYPDYGGRGIRVAERWHNREQFYIDVLPRPEGMWLDRIDNDGDYSPENCEWRTPTQQALNKRPYRTRKKL